MTIDTQSFAIFHAATWTRRASRVMAWPDFATVDEAVAFILAKGGHAEADADHPGYGDAFLHGCLYVIQPALWGWREVEGGGSDHEARS